MYSFSGVHKYADCPGSNSTQQSNDITNMLRLKELICFDNKKKKFLFNSAAERQCKNRKGRKDTTVTFGVSKLLNRYPIELGRV